MLQAAVDGVAQLVGLDTAAVYLREGDMLRLGATTPPLPQGFPDHLRLAPVSDHPHLARAMDSRQTLLIPDCTEVALTEAERMVAEQRHLRTVCFVPLLAESGAIGAFIVGSRDEPTELRRAEMDLSGTLANLTALAVQNARLFAEGERRATELAHALEERERLQAQLIQAQKMESVGRLAGGVAHDFNNMLTIILGHVELALEGGSAHGDHREDLLQIRSAAERSADLTRQLLAFARKQTVAPVLLDLDVTIGNMLKLLRRLIGEDVELAWLPGGDLGQVRIDPAQVDQILANLCVNARDAIEGVGRISIETGNASFDADYCEVHPEFVPGEYVAVAVSDDGCGMDEQTQARIFEPFFTAKSADKGTGLGLSTVYGIVKQNDGFIYVYSEPGVGTTFKLYLPLRREEVEDVREVLAPATLGGDERILLVEDEAMILALAARMLESLGYRVRVAEKPSAAVRIARGDPEGFDLLITDVIMPEMNGRELAERLQGVHPGLRTLFISGYTANVIAHQGILHEGVHFLSKPFTKEQLAARVREALR